MRTLAKSATAQARLNDQAPSHSQHGRTSAGGKLVAGRGSKLKSHKRMGRIILADDDELVAALVVDAFISAGHAIGWLQDGRSALDVIKRRPPDLAILDCNMPEMSGVSVLRELRKSTVLFSLPVLMLTGRQSDSDEEILRYEGANDYLRKPFDPITVVGRAEALMNGERRWD